MAAGTKADGGYRDQSTDRQQGNRTWRTRGAGTWLSFPDRRATDRRNCEALQRERRADEMVRRARAAFLGAQDREHALRRVLSRRLPAGGRAGSHRRGGTRLVAFSARGRMRHQGAHDGSPGQSHQPGGAGREARCGRRGKARARLRHGSEGAHPEPVRAGYRRPRELRPDRQHGAPAAGVACQHAGDARDSSSTTTATPSA